jgi:hypothetical protein
MGAPLALLAQNFKVRRFVKLNASLERVDGEADRSKPAAKITSEIEKTQVQSRCRRDLNALQTRLFIFDSFATRGATEFVATLRVFARFAKRRARQISRCGWLAPLCCNAEGIALLRGHVQNATVAPMRLRLKTGGR